MTIETLSRAVAGALGVVLILTGCVTPEKPDTTASPSNTPVTEEMVADAPLEESPTSDATPEENLPPSKHLGELPESVSHALEYTDWYDGEWKITVEYSWLNDWHAPGTHASETGWRTLEGAVHFTNLTSENQDPVYIINDGGMSLRAVYENEDETGRDSGKCLAGLSFFSSQTMNSPYCSIVLFFFNAEDIYNEGLPMRGVDPGETFVLPFTNTLSIDFDEDGRELSSEEKVGILRDIEWLTDLAVFFSSETTTSDCKYDRTTLYYTATALQYCGEPIKARLIKE